MKHYSQETRAEAVRLYLNGHTHARIAKLLGCSQITVGRWINKQLNAPKPKAKPKAPAEDVKAMDFRMMKKLYDSKCNQLADVYEMLGNSQKVNRNLQSRLFYYQITLVIITFIEVLRWIL